MPPPPPTGIFLIGKTVPRGRLSPSPSPLVLFARSRDPFFSPEEAACLYIQRRPITIIRRREAKSSRNLPAAREGDAFLALLDNNAQYEISETRGKKQKNDTTRVQKITRCAQLRRKDARALSSRFLPMKRNERGNRKEKMIGKGIEGGRYDDESRRIRFRERERDSGASH